LSAEHADLLAMLLSMLQRTLFRTSQMITALRPMSRTLPSMAHALHALNSPIPHALLDLTI